MNVRHGISRIGILFLTVGALLAIACPLRSREPAPLTLLFTANEYGYIEPCG